MNFEVEYVRERLVRNVEEHIHPRENQRIESDEQMIVRWLGEHAISRVNSLERLT